MPLVGKVRSTGAGVDITTLAHPKLELRRGDIECPFCAAELMVVHGNIVSAHFRHLTGECTSALGHHPESREHMLGKRTVREHLWKRFTLICSPPPLIELEVAVPEAGRIADILVTLPGGFQEAHEIQLASLTTMELKERTDAYRRVGIDVQWWLGGKAETDTNRQWVKENIGWCGSIGFRYEDHGDPE